MTLKKDDARLKKAKNKITKIKILTIFTLFIGLSTLFVFVNSIFIEPDIKLSPLEGFYDLSTLYILTAIILFASLLTNIVLFRTIKKMSDSILLSNQEINNIKINQNEYHNDDIKELVATRDMLLYKMIDSKKK